MRRALIWTGFALIVAVPIALAAVSPLLAWRQPVYIAAGFAGIAALALLLTQPLLVGGHLPGFESYRGRRIHRLTGVALVVLVVAHVAGLWIFSPPDVVDALLFNSPTPFSVWGVVAMWALFLAAGLAALRPRLRMRFWRLGHTGLVAIVVVGSVVHALRVDGTMETLSKAALCVVVLAVTLKVIFDRKAWVNKKPGEGRRP